MPFKDPEKRRQHLKAYYSANKKNWKNPDGTWKRPSDYGTNEFRKKHAAWYQRNKKDQNAKCKVRRDAKREYGPCAICKVDCYLYHDHDHKTGEYRGWLCSSCNLMLGHGRDNPQILRAAINYLRRKDTRTTEELAVGRRKLE